ncbi:MAG: cysteine hydrolase [Muriicola sp.]|nr:cysteine hydrolase [Muriicola sp.]MBT8283485.1 cysteine hydrolase [Muriicola sp.]NNK11895.1 cysteine hydrolase [Flavobacteriaceae bacterium]
MNKNQPPALILIDIQKGLEELDYYGGARNNPDAEENAAVLLNFWREKKYPVFHIKHNGTPPSPLTKGMPGNDFKEITAPKDGEPIVEKDSNSAFINTPLHQILQDLNISHLVLVGLTTSHCVSSTARMAGNFGYHTFVISDATATFDTLSPEGKRYEASLVHEITLANLHNEFATVLDTSNILSLLAEI